MLLESYSRLTGRIDFDYSAVREAGVPVKGFGGESQVHNLWLTFTPTFAVFWMRRLAHRFSTSIVGIMNLINQVCGC